MAAKGLKLEIAYSRETVGVRVIARCGGSFGWPSGDLKITGNLSPEDAIAFADALRAKAEQVIAENTKRDAAEQKRAARLAKLPSVSWR